MKDYRTWSSAETFNYDTPVKSFWISDEQLLVCGQYSTEIYNILTRKSQILAVSQADSFGYTTGRESVFASTNGNLFIHSEDSEGWSRVFSIDKAAPVSVSREIPGLHSVSYHQGLMPT